MPRKVHAGEYGGRVVRAFKGDGQSFIAGATLDSEVVMKWPLANRMALHEEGKVDWFGPPSEAENKARSNGKPAVPRGKATKPAEPAKKASSVATPRRRARV